MTERERRAFNRGLEIAAKLSALWADENWRMLHDSLLCDPILNLTATRDTMVRDRKKSEELLTEGHGHAMTAHACEKLAKQIREQKVKSR